MSLLSLFKVGYQTSKGLIHALDFVRDKGGQIFLPIHRGNTMKQALQ